MNLVWWIPTLVVIIVAVVKIVEALQALNREEHLERLVLYVIAAFGLYSLFYYAVLGVFRSLPSVAWPSANPLAVHGVIVGFYVPVFFFMFFKSRGKVKKVGTKEVKRMVEKYDRVSDKISNAREGLEKTNDRIDRVKRETKKERNKILQKIDGIATDVYERYDETNERITEAEREFNKRLETGRDFIRDFEHEIVKLEDYVTNVQNTLESLQGSKADEEGLDYQDKLAERVSLFGFEVEVNKKSGPDIIVKDSSSGEPIAVIGAKAYKLKNRRGLSNELDPELERAREAGLPLVVAVKNKLTGLELFQIYQPESLEDFTCSVPAWFACEERTGEMERKAKKSQDKFRKALESA